MRISPACDNYAASLEQHNGAALSFDFGAGAQGAPELVRELRRRRLSTVTASGRS